MSKETLTVDRARELLVRAVEEKGEGYRYRAPDVATGCAYFHGWEPGCLVGHVFSYLGLTADDLGSDNTGTSAIEAVAMLRLSVDEPALEGLESAQGAQDGGDTWGDALQVFDRVVANWRPSDARL